VCGVAAAQGLSDYIDFYVVKVKPEKRMEFEASIKKMVDANRKHNGDRWLTYVTEYGDQGTFYFASSRTDLASIETASETFMKALNTTFGVAGAQKIFADMSAASVWTRGEIRRRRTDLSGNPPATQDEFYKMLGETRWIRTVKVDLMPGKLREYTELWMPFKAALEKENPGRYIAVSQTITGTPAIYSATYAKSMAEFDTMNANMNKLLEDDAYRNYLRGLSSVATNTKWEIHRIAPELSYPPDEIAAVNPSYWNPKPAAPTKGKSKEPAKGDN
jgi:quinol monooxygenase YgiN